MKVSRLRALDRNIAERASLESRPRPKARGNIVAEEEITYALVTRSCQEDIEGNLSPSFSSSSSSPSSSSGSKEPGHARASATTTTILVRDTGYTRVRRAPPIRKPVLPIALGTLRARHAKFTTARL